jgi:hypothetical protein
MRNAMTENRSGQNPAGNVSQRDDVELHKGTQWDQLMIVTPDYQDESCHQLYRQVAFAWEAASVSGEFGRNGCQATGTARQHKIDADLVHGMFETATEVTPQAKIVVRHDGLCELAHIVMHETDATNAFPSGEGKMNSQPLSPKPAEPDLALIYFGSLFETLRQAPESNESALDALVGHIILDERPKTKLGLALRANAEKWLRRDLWAAEFKSLSPSDQAVRILVDSAMRMVCA